MRMHRINCMLALLFLSMCAASMAQNLEARLSGRAFKFSRGDQSFKIYSNEDKLQSPAQENGVLRVAGPSICFAADIAVGVLPGRQLEDVLYRPEEFGEGATVHVPSENWFAALLHGGNGILVLAWAGDGARLSLHGKGVGEEARFRVIGLDDFEGDLYCALLTAPAIWHRLPLAAGYLEKDVPIDWQPPFPATYKTQLRVRGETAALRSFVFQRKRNTQYRPEIGEVAWPVWFESRHPMIRLGKKIPPRGEAIIYPMEGAENSLMGFISKTPLADTIEARSALAPLPRGPRDAANVGFVACGGTAVMRNTIFAKGMQSREKEFLLEYADFLSDYVAIVQQRHQAFFKFISDTAEKVATWKKADGDSDYLAAMAQRARETESGMRREMVLYGGDSPEAHMARAAKDADRLKELLKTDHAEVFSECNAIIYRCNRLAWGHTEGGGMRFSMLSRDWAQQAARDVADTPEALGYAVEIRAAIRHALNGAPPW
jgi:hypothetical protein